MKYSLVENIEYLIVHALDWLPESIQLLVLLLVLCHNSSISHIILCFQADFIFFSWNKIYELLFVFCAIVIDQMFEEVAVA